MLKIKTKMQFNTIDVEQTQYLFKNYIITLANNKKILFKDNENYIINEETNKLEIPDFSAQLQQLKKMKQMAGETIIEENTEAENFKTFETRKVKFTNANKSTISIEGEMNISKIPNLEKTALWQQRKTEEDKQLFKIELEKNEIISYSKINISIDSKNQQTISEITEIEEFEYNTEFEKYTEWNTDDTD